LVFGFFFSGFAVVLLKTKISWKDQQGPIRAIYDTQTEGIWGVIAHRKKEDRSFEWRLYTGTTKLGSGQLVTEFGGLRLGYDVIKHTMKVDSGDVSTKFRSINQLHDLQTALVVPLHWA
jgi:hypothetical protein